MMAKKPKTKDRYRTTLGLKVGQARGHGLAIGHALLKTKIPRAYPPASMERLPIDDAADYWAKVQAMVAAVKERAAAEGAEKLRLFRWSEDRFHLSEAYAEGGTYEQYALLMADVADQLQLAGYLVEFEDLERDVD